MYVILSNLPEKLKDFLVLKFLSFGLDLYLGENPKSVEKLLEEKGPGYIFISLTQLNDPWFNFLAELRQYKDKDYFKLIVLSDRTDRDFVQTLLLLSVTGMIPRLIESEDILKRLQKLIKMKETGHEKRESQRVTPRETDNILVNISIPNSSTILSAKVINVSMGGLALQLNGTGEARWLSNGQIIESAQMRLNGKIGITGLKVAAIKDSFVGVRYVKPTDFFLNLLGKYLVERLAG